MNIIGACQLPSRRQMPNISIRSILFRHGRTMYVTLRMNDRALARGSHHARTTLRDENTRTSHQANDGLGFTFGAGSGLDRNVRKESNISFGPLGSIAAPEEGELCTSSTSRNHIWGLPEYFRKRAELFIEAASRKHKESWRK